jgi:MFS family permease
MWSVSRLAIIADTGPAGQRGRQITGMFTMETTGRMLGPTVGGLLAALYDMRAPFILHGLLCLLVIIPSVRLARESAAHTKARAEAGVGGVSVRAGLAALLTLPVIMFLIAYFLSSFARGPMFSGALFLYPVYYYGVGPGEIGVVETIASIIAIPIMLMAGHVMDRYGRKATIVPGFAMLAVALALTAVTSWAGMPFPAFVVAYLLVMASVSVTSGNMQTLGADIVPERGRGVFLGVWMLIGQLAMTIAPWAMGTLSAGYSYAVAFLAFAVSSAAVAVIVGTQVPETVRRAEPVKSSA